MSACLGEQYECLYIAVCHIIDSSFLTFSPIPHPPLLLNRLLDIVDPENVEAGPILKLEHEVRSVVKRDGSKYKSCPFDEIPECCVV